MSRWADVAAMRRFNGLPFDDSDPNYDSDASLEYYIDRAQIAVRSDIMTLVRDDQMSGDIDGSNTGFYVTFYPIADENYDGSLNLHDVTCYGWGDLSDFPTKTSLATSSINFKEGRVVLASAPSSTYDVITCDYHYSLYEMDFDLIEQATAYRAGWAYFRAKYMEVPSNVRIGAQAYRMEDPSTKAKYAYLELMNYIKTELISSWTKKGTKLRRP